MQSLALLAIIRPESCDNVCCWYSWLPSMASSVPPPSNISMSNHGAAGARAGSSRYSVLRVVWAHMRSPDSRLGPMSIHSAFCPRPDGRWIVSRCQSLAASFIGHIEPILKCEPHASLGPTTTTATAACQQQRGRDQEICQYPWEIIFSALACKCGYFGALHV